MRLIIDSGTQRLLRRVPRVAVYSALEILLLSLLALQCARLVWTLVTPLTPVGDWKGASALRPVAANEANALAGFDPFFRSDGEDVAGAAATSLTLQLFGTREDRASGSGSAIIGTPDGRQRSFTVGEEVSPGVRLAAVGFDSVSLTRGGRPEQLVMARAQISSTQISSPTPAAAATLQDPAAGSQNPAASSAVMREIRFQARMRDGRMTGVLVEPQGAGQAFYAAGLEPNDVITAVNGQQIVSPEQAQTLAEQLRGSDANLEVMRRGEKIALKVKADRLRPAN